MSTRTIYKCDKCGSEQDKPSGFWNVGVMARARDSAVSPFDTYATGMSMEVCRPCLEKLGIHVQKKLEEDPAANAP